MALRVNPLVVTSLCVICVIGGSASLVHQWIQPRVKLAEENLALKEAFAWLGQIRGSEMNVLKDIEQCETSFDPKSVVVLSCNLDSPAQASENESKRHAIKIIASGYIDDIELGVEIRQPSAGTATIGTILVISHRETRGFGADLLANESPWIAGLQGAGRSKINSYLAPIDQASIAENQAMVLDGMSGATITGRAVLRTLSHALGRANQYTDSVPSLSPAP